MQVKTFILPVLSSERSESELNRFLRSHRVLQMERHFCADNGGYWAVLVEYVEGDPAESVPPAHRRDKQDASQGLTEEEKGRFEYFKQVRRQLATENAIPAYLIFTNEELATLARVPELNAESVKGVKGIAPSRLKAYVEHFYVVTDAKEGGQSDAEDSIDGEPA